jgi:ATP-binding cassette subfamily C protein
VVTGALHRSTAAGARPDTAAIARLTHQVEIVRDTFAGLVMVIRGFLFATGAALLGLLSLAPIVAALVAAPLLAGLVAFASGLPAMVTRQREYVHADEQLGESASAALSGHRDVVACGAQDVVADRVGARIDGQAAAERALARMAALRSLSLALGGWLPLVVLLVVAPWLVRHGLTAGAVLGALVYVSTGLQPALHALVQGVAGGGLRFAVTLDRILRASVLPPGVPALAVRPAPRSAAAVQMRGLAFRYGPHAKPVVHNFDLALRHGEHLAVVGPSGAGKSTLAALMAGLLSPQRGTVRLDGLQATGAAPAALAACRVLIPQEAYVFSGSLADNLRYLCPDASDAHVDAALDVLGMRPLVFRLGGRAARVDPATLSAGERQLIALARAYLSPAPLVILDEATCHLDPAIESRVEWAFAARPGTLIVIAHRISSALRARLVLILDGGRPMLGSHDALLARSVTYRDLVGHWHGAPEQQRTRPATGVTGAGSRLDPARLAGDPYRLDPGTGAGFGRDPGQVVAYRPGG